MTAQLQLTRQLNERGVRTRFVATGQTGIMIEGWGIAVDAVVADFIAGAAERLVLEGRRDADVVLVEGQGSINHPGYSGVTLGLLHGSCPDALILCHQSSREYIGDYREAAWLRIPPLTEYIRLYEAIGAAVHPTKVIGISLNTYDLTDAEARRACEAAARETGLPATDPVRFDPRSAGRRGRERAGSVDEQAAALSDRTACTRRLSGVSVRAKGRRSAVLIAMARAIIGHAPRRPFPPPLLLPAPPRAGLRPPRGTSRRLGAHGPVATSPARGADAPCWPASDLGFLLRRCGGLLVRDGARRRRARRRATDRLADAADRGWRARISRLSAELRALYPGLRVDDGAHRVAPRARRRRAGARRCAPPHGCRSPATWIDVSRRRLRLTRRPARVLG